MRIGVDARYLSHGLIGGVHSYVSYLVSGLAKYAPDHQIFLYADQKRPFEIADLPDNVKLRLLPWKGTLSSVYYDFLMWQSMKNDQLDVVHFPANYGFAPPNVSCVVTLHDVINILPLTEIIRGHRKDPRSLVMMPYLHFCTLWSLRKVTRVVTVSEYSKKEIVRLSRLNAGQVEAMTHGPSPSLQRVEDVRIHDSVRQKYSLDRPFVLADALKNPAVLVRAWEKLPDEIRDRWQIVFFSRTPEPLPIVHEAVSRGFARLLVRPPFEDLMTLYSMTQAFIFPSWYEGLGLPLLEAMICGAPIIASDRGSIPEVCGGAALLIDAEDDAALADHIGQLFHSPEASEKLRSLGYERAVQFRWDKITSRLLACYQTAIDARKQIKS